MVVTFVTKCAGDMTANLGIDRVRRSAMSLDPRRSLASKVAWFIAGLSLAFALLAALWLGEMTRDGLLQQHARQFDLDAAQLAGILDRAIERRVLSLQAIAAIAGSDVDLHHPGAMRAIINDLRSTYPELEWIGFADTTGRIVAAADGRWEDTAAGDHAWFAHGRTAAWLGEERAAPTDERAPADAGRVIDIAVPVRDAQGRALGVMDAHLSPAWLEQYTRDLGRALRHPDAPQAMVLDRDGVVVAGPEEFVHRPWPLRSVPTVNPYPAGAAAAGGDAAGPGPRAQRLADGRMLLVSGIDPRAGGALGSLGWSFQLAEPASRGERRADGLWGQILWISLALGGVAALFGILMSRRLMSRLSQLSRSVDTVGAGGARSIEVPAGADEVSRLGRAFARLLQALQQEREELAALGAQLEQRVEARSREVERLARETRYAAVVRERLKIARDLHDTLAHSMMAMLAEVRLLKRLHAREPAALADELVRAEQVAREGLIEARASIAQMRFNPVRDAGLGEGLAGALKRMAERSGLHVEMDFDPRAASFAEEAAEAAFRIAEEALRNIERHGNATRVRVRLHGAGDGVFVLTIEDDGVGFDADAAHAGHYGLVGMREQAQLIGARLELRSVSGAGTTVRLTFGPGAQR